jgi:hypothetical protein
MGASHKDTASQQRNPGGVSKDHRGSAKLMRFGYKQLIPALAAGAAAVPIAAAPTAMAKPAAVRPPLTTTAPVAVDAGWHGGGRGGWHGGGPGGWHGRGWHGGGWHGGSWRPWGWW